MMDTPALDTPPTSALAGILASSRAGNLPTSEQITAAATSDGVDPALPLDELVVSVSKIKSRPELRVAILAVAHLTAIREMQTYRQAMVAKSKPDPEATRQKILAWWTPERKATHAKLMAEKAAAKKAATHWTDTPAAIDSPIA